MGALQGLMTMVVEDDFFISVELADELDRAGAHVIGPFPDVGSARRAMAQPDIGLAIVDLALQEGFAYPLLCDLRQAGVPTVIASAYSSQEIDPSFHSFRRIESPTGRPT